MGQKKEFKKFRKVKRQKRPCLNCKHIFMSEGNHHRLCNRCKVPVYDPHYTVIR